MELIAIWITAVSTLAMAIIAGIALNTWKNEQKRTKLVNLLETLNSYIQDLQYYELESTLFSKQARQKGLEDFKNIQLILEQKRLIDTELAEGIGHCILELKNWLIQDNTQYEKLNNLNKSIQEYRIKIFEFIEQKIDYWTNQNAADIMYGSNKDQLQQVFNKKTDLEKYREQVVKQIEEFKNHYEKLLK